jgi:hypothetical protein
LLSYRLVPWEMGFGKREKWEGGFGGSRGFGTRVFGFGTLG